MLPAPVNDRMFKDDPKSVVNTSSWRQWFSQLMSLASTLIGGSNTQIQFNNSGNMGGSSGLTWLNTKQSLVVDNTAGDSTKSAVTVNDVLGAGGIYIYVPGPDIYGVKVVNYDGQTNIYDKRMTINGATENGKIQLSSSVSYASGNFFEVLDYLGNTKTFINYAGYLRVAGTSTPAYPIDLTGNIRTDSISVGTTPDAKIKISASSGAAGTAPIKFSAGTLLGALELGALEFVDNGTNGHLYITRNIAGVLTRSLII